MGAKGHAVQAMKDMQVAANALATVSQAFGSCVPNDAKTQDAIIITGDAHQKIKEFLNLYREKFGNAISHAKKAGFKF